ncbi:MAG: hypothetical protein LBR53_02575 [Deltaproteobacteria bacterium]|jgi:hypothetical protein|nr:hypothetical protein [Deltaproteobacteria bacterium]
MKRVNAWAEAYRIFASRKGGERFGNPDPAKGEKFQKAAEDIRRPARLGLAAMVETRIPVKNRDKAMAAIPTPDNASRS